MATDEDVPTTDFRKIANVLALLLVKDMNKGGAAQVLRRCGFSNKETAALTGTTEGSIRGFLSHQRKRPSAEE